MCKTKRKYSLAMWHKRIKQQKIVGITCDAQSEDDEDVPMQREICIYVRSEPRLRVLRATCIIYLCLHATLTLAFQKHATLEIIL